MDVPRENVIAAFPPSVKAGNVVIRPLTLGGAIRLAERGISTGTRVPKDKLFVAAWILSGEADLKKFLRRAKCGLQELSNAVEEVLNTAYETFVKPAAAQGKQVGHMTPHGLGWPLEFAEWLCAEYGWSWQTALATPVATVYALAAACRQRNGGRHAGLDYIERKYRADIKAGKAKPLTIDN